MRVVWLCSAAFFALLLYHAPMAVFVRAAFDEPTGAWVCVGFLLHPVLIERTVYISRFPKKPKKADIGLRAVLRVFQGLWQKKSSHVDVKLEIDSGDAAATALLYGGFCALAAGLAGRVRFRVMPQYGRQDAHFAFRGMLWAKTGHIAMAAYAYFRQKRRKENGQKAH